MKKYNDICTLLNQGKNIKEIISFIYPQLSEYIEMDNLGNIIIKNNGEKQKIMISALVKENKITISKIENKKAYFEKTDGVNELALNDEEIYHNDKSVGIIRSETEDKKIKKQHLYLWEKESVKIGDLCRINYRIDCKGNLLYGTNLNSIILVKTIVSLITELTKCEKQICFTISFSQNALLSLVNRINPSEIYYLTTEKSTDNFELSKGVGIVYKDTNYVIDNSLKEKVLKLSEDKISYQIYIDKASTLPEKISISGQGPKILALYLATEGCLSKNEICSVDDIKSLIDVLIHFTNN